MEDLRKEDEGKIRLALESRKRKKEGIIACEEGKKKKRKRRGSQRY